MNNLIDLHTHSIYSDGEYTPDELIKMAKEIGITTMSITDHDTISGYKNINSDGIDLIPGIELSTKTDIGQMHILGYNIDLNNDKLNSIMEELRNSSISSVKNILKQIDIDYNIKFPEDEIKTLLESKSNIGRPNIANLCVKYNYCETFHQAFDKYLTDAYQKTQKESKHLAPQESIQLIKIAGGIPVLAHPKTLLRNNQELIDQIKELITYGLEGIEVYHSSHSKEEIKLYEQIANDFNLLISGGSDYHGPIATPDKHLGTGTNNNLNITHLTILDKIKSR